MKAIERFLLLLAAIAFFILPNSHQLGASELGREEAARLLRDALKNESRSYISKSYQKYGFLYSIDSELTNVNKYKELEKKGYLIVKDFPELKTATVSNKSYFIEFTDKALPYVLNAGDSSGNNAYIALAKVENLDITGIKMIAPNEYNAEVSLGYKLTPFGEILLGRGIRLERKGDASFEAQDDGWRIKFKTTF